MSDRALAAALAAAAIVLPPHIGGEPIARLEAVVQHVNILTS
ncbi:MULTISPECIES: hypothetical protein [Nonomuraea]|uniref:Uncharacterized protein n=2 Tax=Nonomuraea TaxID=83681 RepID=A0ABW1BXS6_9ACTN|nr:MULTISPECIES: hypothetical protein [Nonomuraea]MDA0644414.1 hypothetical protein [Nonomuraea ferruginea]